MRTDGLSAAEMMLGKDAAGLRRRLTKRGEGKKPRRTERSILKMRRSRRRRRIVVVIIILFIITLTLTTMASVMMMRMIKKKCL